MRFQCDSSNCYLERHVLNFSKVSAYLSDIDAVCERYGFFLFMEWKESREGFTENIGQQILFQNLSRQRHGSLKIFSTVVIQVVGNAGTGEPVEIRNIYKGQVMDWVPCNRKELQERVDHFWSRATEKGSP